MKQFKVQYRKTDLLYMYKEICREKKVPVSDLIRGFMQSKPFRSQSGVMVYAVFTHPFWKSGANGELKAFSCKYDCAYCPEKPGRPRSYVDGEPGLDRARNVNYDTVRQVLTRANSYRATGHINDKAEVIVLGGTWHSYPLEYRREFIRDLYYAFNTVHESRGRNKLTMKQEIELNQKSKCRVIGLTIETRPDQISPKELVELREMGVTRVQLGVQHTNDHMLTRIKRRCTAQHAIDAIKLLKDCGFKVDIHLMPDLPKPFTQEFEIANKTRLNSKSLSYGIEDIDQEFDSVEEDRKMFQTVFHGESYCPYQVKIYPCEVMDWTKIKEDFEQGIHVPYGEILEDQETNELIMLLIDVKSKIPRWVRINRLIRDIPESYVLGGINDTNGRQRVERIMKGMGLKCNCMRCREIKKKKIDPETARFEIIEYRASGGDEYFLQYVTPEDDLIGFLRLRLSDDSGIEIKTKRSGVVKKTIIFQELLDTAMIRELHVYGEAVKVNRNNSNKTDRSQQHVGFGTKLLHQAFRIAAEKGYHRISVISGEGVKPYYRRFGFVDGEHFLIKTVDGSELSDRGCSVM